MNTIDRYNLQKGVENRYSNNNVQSALDAYILARVEKKQNHDRRIILDPAAYNTFLSSTAATLAKKIQNAVGH